MTTLKELPCVVQALITPVNVRKTANDTLMLRIWDIKQIAENILIVSSLSSLHQYLQTPLTPDGDSTFEKILTALILESIPFSKGYAITLLDQWSDAQQQESLAKSSQFSFWYTELADLFSSNKRRIEGQKKAQEILDAMLARLTPLLTIAPFSDLKLFESLRPLFWFINDRPMILRQAVYHNKERDWEMKLQDMGRQAIQSITVKNLGPNFGKWYKKALEKKTAPSVQHCSEAMIKPVILENNPSLVKLAEFIVQNTEKKTHEAIWINPYWETKKNQIAGNDTRAAYQTFSSQVNLTELVLMDCIERSPIDVLLDVAAHEQEKELEGYIHMLAPTDKDASVYIENADSSLSDLRSAGDSWRKRRLALYVLRLLGFNICEHTKLHGIDYIRAMLKQIEHESNEESKTIRTYTGCIADICSQVIEPFLRDMTIFYSAVANYNRLESSEWKKRGRDRFNTSGIGTFVGILKELARSESLQRTLQERAGFFSPFLNETAFCRALNEGTEYSIVEVRNWISHTQDKKEKPLFPASRRSDRHFMEDLCSLVISTAKSLMDLCAPEGGNELACRIYPFKLTFTMQQRYHVGFNRFSYITEVADTDSVADKKGSYIYTTEDIKFGHVYYVLPHRSRMTTSLWMDPLIIDDAYLS